MMDPGKLIVAWACHARRGKTHNLQYLSLDRCCPPCEDTNCSEQIKLISTKILEVIADFPPPRFKDREGPNTRQAVTDLSVRVLTREAGMAIFIALKRPGPPAKEVLVNLDEILMVQPGQGSGSAILFGREHLVSFEEDVPTVIRRIQTGPYIRTDHA
jgi:hypothetical protein